jgi:hypothetical protein
LGNGTERPRSQVWLREDIIGKDLFAKPLDKKRKKTEEREGSLTKENGM